MQELSIDGEDARETPSFKTETDRINMMDLAAKILEAQADDFMQKLTIKFFRNEVDKKDVKDEDKSFINSIVRSGQTKLTYLNLKANDTWFGDDEATEHLCAFIQEQTSLKELIMEYNYMSSSATEQVLSAVLESGSIATIESIEMRKSADFSSEGSCTLLA